MRNVKAFSSFCSVILLSLTLLILPGTAGAMDVKISGLWQFRPFSWAQRNLKKGHSDDRLRAANRLRSEIEFIASENLKGVFAFQIGHQNWGMQSQGGALGTDGKMFSVRRSYLDWAIPNGATRVRMGLQTFDLPSMTGIGNAIVNTNAAGLTVSHQFSDEITGTLFWARLENNNATPDEGQDPKSYNPHDAMDYIGFALPVKADTFKVTPWGMYGFVGRDSFKNTGIGQSILQNGMLPLGGTAALAATSDEAHGYSWYTGLATQWKPMNNLTLALDAAYGTVDVGNTTFKGSSFDLQRAGWYTALLAEYKLDFGVPGLIVWYSSGDDANPYNGSERMPSIWPDMFYSSYGADFTWYGGAAQTLGLGLSGSWAAMLRIKDLTFYEKLSHTIRLIHYQGTNDKEMVRKGFITNPQATLTSFTYMTTGDQAIEVNIDTNYMLYKDLKISLELGYIRMHQDKGLWSEVGYEANKNNYKCTVSFNYTF